jgi:hypothetical protein
MDAGEGRFDITDATGERHGIGCVLRRLLVVGIEGAGLALALTAIGLVWQTLA